MNRDKPAWKGDGMNMKLFEWPEAARPQTEAHNSESAAQEERFRLSLNLGNTAVSLLQRYRWEIEEIRSSRFIQELEAWKEELSKATQNKDIIRLRNELFEKVSTYLEREKDYLAEREAELKRMITLLCEAVSTITSGNGDYHRHIMESTHNLSEISHLEDIRKIRSLLSTEVQQLKLTVKEKQAQEKQQFEQLQQHVEVLQTKLETAVNRSLMDSLTSLYNRQGWDQEIRNACRAASLTGNGFVVALVDLDDFKQINDSAGHQVGDLVLAEFGKILKRSFRTDDYIARYGGDEFAFLLNTPSLEKAQQRLEHLCKSLAKETYCCKLNGKAYYLKIHITCGLSLYRSGDKPEALLQRADEALYRAKKMGKNRVLSDSPTGGGLNLSNCG